MKKVIIKDGIIKNLDRAVACIGYFDGVHLGHQQLITKTVSEAKRLKIKSAVICFEPDPVNLIIGKKNKHILSYKNRLAAFESYGIEQVIVIRFDDDFMKLSPISFINNYLNKFNLEELICGFDYTFGYKAKGDGSLLKQRANFKTLVIEEKKYLGEKISSTRIKQAFISGDFSLTNKLLGYQYQLELKVTNSFKMGDKWLIEAKLIDDDCILPKEGKYTRNLEIRDNKVYVFLPDSIDKNSHIYLAPDEI